MKLRAWRHICVSNSPHFKYQNIEKLNNFLDSVKSSSNAIKFLI